MELAIVIIAIICWLGVPAWVAEKVDSDGLGGFLMFVGLIPLVYGLNHVDESLGWGVLALIFHVGMFLLIVNGIFAVGDIVGAAQKYNNQPVDYAHDHGGAYHSHPHEGLHSHKGHPHDDSNPLPPV